MAFIEVIEPREASGRLAKIYRLVRGPGGQVDNVLQIHSLRPHSLEGHMALYKSVLHDTHNKLPVWYLEAVGVLVSRLNKCDYCDGHHAAGLKRLLRSLDMDFAEYDRALDRILSGVQPGEPFTTREQAGLAYAMKLTHAPGSIEQADIDYLRAQGLNDGEILELNQVASYFAYANRTVTGLGVSAAGETLGLSPAHSDGQDAWQHQ